MAKKKSTEKVKCPGCHAYFVEEGEQCANCEKKENHEENEEIDDENDNDNDD